MAEHALTAESSTARWSSGLPRRALLIDAIGSGVAALLLLVGAEWLSPYLGLSVSFLRGVGLGLVPWFALLLFAAGGPSRWTSAIRPVIAVNLLWVVASAGLLIADLASPTLLGIAVVIVQAIVVLGIATLQCLGWSRGRSTT